MKWLELTEYSTSEKIIVNVEKIDFMVRVDDLTSIRIGGDEFAVCETPDEIINQISRSRWRTLND